MWGSERLPLILIPGAFFLTFGRTLIPFYGASAAYAVGLPNVPANATMAELSSAGVLTPGFTASFGMKSKTAHIMAARID